MSVPPQPNVKLTNAPEYRETYANSVQMRVNVWDFFLVFGTVQQQSETQVEIRNFQGIYLSPQQAKALLGLLQQNVSGYETAFGEIKLDPRMSPAGRCIKAFPNLDSRRAGDLGADSSEGTRFLFSWLNRLFFEMSFQTQTGGRSERSPVVPPRSSAMVGQLPSPSVRGHLCVCFSTACTSTPACILLG